MGLGWEYWLVRSSDMVSLGKLDQAHERTLTVGHNQSGSAEFWLPIDDPMALKVDKWRTAVVAQRDNKRIWSGPVLKVNSKAPDDRCTVNAVGWFERLNHRVVLSMGLQWYLQDAAVLVFGLLAEANSYGTTRITAGTSEPTVQRTRMYPVDANIGSEITNLANIESGVDWRIDPTTRVINLYARYGTDRTGVLFGYNYGPRNLVDFEEDDDGSVQVNDMHARGNAGVFGFDQDPVSIAQYDVLQENPSLSDVNDVNILGAYATAEIVYRAYGRTMYTFTPKTWTKPAPGKKASVPRIFDDYDMGDTVYVSAKRGRINVKHQAVRIFGATLSIDDNGVENITSISTSAS